MTNILEQIEMGRRHKNNETGLIVTPIMVAYNETDRENPLLILNTGGNFKNILYIKPEDFINQYSLI